MKTIADFNKQIKKIKKQRIAKIAKNVFHYRSLNKYTQLELSELIGAERTTIVNIENGKQNITVETLMNICEVFGITPNDILIN